MDFRQLSNFVRIVDSGSLTGAAKIIGVAQPALTFQIGRLEEELGAQLLIRGARGVKATEAGLILYGQARTMMRQLQQIPELVRTAVAEPAGEVTIGLPSAFTPFFSAALVEVVRLRFPRMKLQIFEGDSVLQRELLLHNRIELALVCEHGIVSNSLYRRPLFSQRLALVCDGADAADQCGEPIRLADAVERIASTPSRGNPIRDAFDDAVGRLGLRSQIRAELNSAHTLIEAVGWGLGASIATWTPFNKMRPGVPLLFRPIVEPEVTLQVSLCRSKLVSLSPPALLVEEALVHLVLERIGRGDWPGATPLETPP